MLDEEALLSKAAVADIPVQPPSLLKRVQEMLGVHRLRSDQDLVRVVEDRLGTGAINNLRRSGLTELNASRRARRCVSVRLGTMSE